MKTLLLTIILSFSTICYSKSFDETVLNNVVHIVEPKNINHVNDPLPITKGSGFLIELEQTYIVTAKHILRDLKTNFILVEKYKQNAIDQRTVLIKRANKPLWLEHPKEDIALIPIDIYDSDLNITNLDMKQEVPFGAYALSIGFSDGHFEATVRGGNISFNTLRDKVTELFFDARIRSGESGSPVYVPSMEKIIGINVSIEEDREIANVVPIHFISEIKKQ